MADATAFPLCWPAGWRRTSPGRRTGAKFLVGRTHWDNGQIKQPRRLEIGDGVSRIMGELERMGIPLRSVIISSDLKLRGDGLPYSSQATAKLDPGVAVYWNDKGGQRCMAIDRYDRIADNLGAVAATIEAMRAIERHGGAEILDRAFTGFIALPAPAAQDLPHEVLGVAETAALAEIEDAYRRLAMQCHPDRGGSHNSMARINSARAAMLARFSL